MSHGVIRARVVDADSRPVAGVLVQSVYDVNRVGRRPMQGRERITANYVFLQVRTDVDGYARIAALERDQLLWADDGLRMSSMERARGSSDVELQLTTGVTVTGRVIADEVEVSFVGAEVSAYALLGSGGDRVAVQQLTPRETFGPIRLPVARGIRYSFQAQGPGFTASSVEVDPSITGGAIDLEIHVQRGVIVPVRVIDEARKPIAGAYVFFQWQLGSQWEKARGISDDAGMVDVGRIPTGSAWLSAKAAGYVESQAQYPIEANVAPYIEVALNRAGSVTGKVTHAGEPVRDFQIYSWSGSASNHRVEGFRDRADGSFVLDQAPIGDLSLLAVGDDLPRSDVEHVTIRAGVTGDPVNIELPAALAATGQVVDALTGEPIPNAVVQAWTSADGALLGKFAAPVRTGTDGGFALTAFSNGRGAFEVSKDGYAPSVHSFISAADGNSDVGIIPLSTGLSLEVRLILDGGADPTRYLIQLAGPELRNARPFESTGVAQFTGLPAGQWRIRVTAPDDSNREESVQLESRLMHRVDVAMPRDSSFSFIIVDERVNARTRPAVLGLIDADPSARGLNREVYATIPESGRLEIGGVQFDDAVACLVDENREVLSYLRIPSLRAAPKPIRIEASADEAVVRVVDRRGEPVPNVALVFLQQDGGWTGAGKADAAGIAAFPAPPSVP
ncbi:MAG: carboxypeptidase-like regulatory domain-containing protein, partial [Rhodoglobus sp.]